MTPTERRLVEALEMAIEFVPILDEELPTRYPRGLYHQCKQALALAKSPPVAQEDEVEELAKDIEIAWGKYTKFFGEPPHGTLKQIQAMLCFLSNGYSRHPKEDSNERD